MKSRIAATALIVGCLFTGHAELNAGSAPVIGEIVTTWKNTFKPGAESDRLVIERFDDPKVEGVSCYVQRARAGGYLAVLGMAEDPSHYSIDCVGTGKITVGNIDKSKSGESVFSASANAFFKTVNVTRHWDEEKKSLLYTVWSSKLVDGSPSNSITAINVGAK